MKIRAASAADVYGIAEIDMSSWRNTYKNVLTARYLSEFVPKERIKIWESRLNSPKPNRYEY